MTIQEAIAYWKSQGYKIIDRGDGLYLITAPGGEQAVLLGSQIIADAMRDRVPRNLPPGVPWPPMKTATVFEDVNGTLMEVKKEVIDWEAFFAGWEQFGGNEPPPFQGFATLPEATARQAEVKAALGGNWKVHYDPASDKYIVVPVEDEQFEGFATRGEAFKKLSEVGVGYEIQYDPATNRYFVVPKQEEEFQGFATEQEADARLAQLGAGYEKHYNEQTDTWTVREIEAGEDRYLGTVEEGGWLIDQYGHVDPDTGQQVITSRSPRQPIKDPIVSIQDQIAKAIQGVDFNDPDWATAEGYKRAQALFQFSTQPTSTEKLQMALAIAQSPSDYLTLVGLYTGAISRENPARVGERIAPLMPELQAAAARFFLDIPGITPPKPPTTDAVTTPTEPETEPEVVNDLEMERRGFYKWADGTWHDEPDPTTISGDDGERTPTGWSLDTSRPGFTPEGVPITPFQPTGAADREILYKWADGTMHSEPETDVLTDEETRLVEAFHESDEQLREAGIYRWADGTLHRSPEPISTQVQEQGWAETLRSAGFDDAYIEAWIARRRAEAGITTQEEEATNKPVVIGTPPGPPVIDTGGGAVKPLGTVATGTQAVVGALESPGGKLWREGREGIGAVGQQPVQGPSALSPAALSKVMPKALGTVASPDEGDNGGVSSLMAGIIADLAKGGKKKKTIPEFQTGGVVPGATGMPRLVQAEGGEVILTPEQITTLVRTSGLFGPVYRPPASQYQGLFTAPQRVTIASLTGLRPRSRQTMRQTTPTQQSLFSSLVRGFGVPLEDWQREEERTTAIGGQRPGVQFRPGMIRRL